MAKPIKSVQTLTGSEADLFLKKMIFVERSKVTLERKKMAEDIKKNIGLLSVC